MTTQEVAEKLVALCRQGQFAEAQASLYADDAESLEPAHSQAPYTKGLDKIRAKGEAWRAVMEEVHGGFVSDPLVAGSFFTLTMGQDVTLKGMGRMNLEEVAVYEVRDGRIVKEQFFF